MPTWHSADSAGLIELAGDFEIEVDVTPSFASGVELRFIEDGGIIAQPSTGKQVSLAVDASGVLKARYFNGNAWVGL
jgi:hypothetical protein